jgi:hypothetical protein
LGLRENLAQFVLLVAVNGSSGVVNAWITSRT